MRRRRLRRARLWKRVAIAEAEATGRVRARLLGPIHGTVQTIRGMCSDQVDIEEIDAKLAELDDLIYEAAGLLGSGR